jgi:hypothetical protein
MRGPHMDHVFVRVLKNRTQSLPLNVASHVIFLTTIPAFTIKIKKHFLACTSAKCPLPTCFIWKVLVKTSV